MLAPARLSEAPKPVFDVAGQIEIHQTVGGADLHLGVVILGGQDQRIEAALRPIGNLLDGFHAHVDDRDA